MIRSLINRFSRSLNEKMVSSRRGHQAPIKIWFDPDIKTERALEAARAACVLGHTVDISRTGIAFLVPSIRVKEKYLVGHERMLNVEIDLPSGKINMRVMGKRYEMVGEHSTTERFHVGAHIVEVAGESKENFNSFLRRGNGKSGLPSVGLELGSD
ncbi:MAG: PilZ domain-containing protein [Chloracidobacterium sp.]|nr:PilZ domain-containing protein [Chloracidobacterium sp.]